MKTRNGNNNIHSSIVSHLIYLLIISLVSFPIPRTFGAFKNEIPEGLESLRTYLLPVI